MAPDPEQSSDSLRELARGSAGISCPSSDASPAISTAPPSRRSRRSSTRSPTCPRPRCRSARRSTASATPSSSSRSRPTAPRPGRVHVAFYASGGFSGRRHTFLAGLDDARHPGGTSRIRSFSTTNGGASTPRCPGRFSRSRESGRERRPRRSSSASRVWQGTLTASYSKFDLRNLSQSGEPAPSPFFLDLYRVVSGRPDADYRAMIDDLETRRGLRARFRRGPRRLGVVAVARARRRTRRAAPRRPGSTRPIPGSRTDARPRRRAPAMTSRPGTGGCGARRPSSTRDAPANRSRPRGSRLWRTARSRTFSSTCCASSPRTTSSAT